MENKRLDPNQIIGFVLISILLGAFFYLNPNKKKETNSTDDSSTVEESTTPGDANQSVRETSTDIYSDTKTVNAEIVRLQNEQLTVGISTFGGQIQEVKLNNEYAYDSDDGSHRHDLYLINENARLNFELATQGIKYDTQSLEFSAKSSNDRVTLSAPIENGAIVFTYRLGEDYKLHFDVKTENIELSAADNQVPMSFDFNAFALEKGRRQEQSYNKSYYRFKENRDVDSGPLFGNNWEEEEALDWVAFKQQFFGSVLQNNQGFVNSSMEIDEVSEDDLAHIKKFAFKGHVLTENQSLNQEMTWTLHRLK